MKTPCISIIVPVYNAEKYLPQCLDSVLAQTYKDWECILIDDGSKDSSGKICDEYVGKDSRFSVIHKQNGGVSAARNLGISKSHGTYVCFLDSDDMMKPTMLETAVANIHDADLCLFGFVRWNGRTDEMRMEEANISEANKCEEYLYNLKENPSTSEFFCFPWNKLYRRSLLINHGITFPTDISMREDEIFAYRYLPFISSLRSITDVLIEYNDASYGLSSKIMKPEKCILLAGYLIEQTKADNSTKSKTILYIRAMLYMLAAIQNISSWHAKKTIAQKMINYERERSFPYDASQTKGKQARLIIKALGYKREAPIILLSAFLKLNNYYRMYILGDKNIKRWGINF